MQLDGNSNFCTYDWTAAVMSPLIIESSIKLVLDIGAGDGRMLALIAAGGGEPRGFDLVPSSDKIIRWDLDEPPASNWPLAGGALLMDVIEHCNNPGLALRHVAEALLPGGFLVLTTPNPRWSRSRIFALLSGYPACFTQSDLDINHHVFTPWPHVLKRMLTDAGFQVEHYTTLDGKREWPGRPFNLHYPARLVMAAAMKAIERRDPSACGMSYGIIARRMR